MMKEIARVNGAPGRKKLKPVEGIGEYVRDVDTCRADSHWQSLEVRLKPYGHGKT